MYCVVYIISYGIIFARFQKRKGETMFLKNLLSFFAFSVALMSLMVAMQPAFVMLGVLNTSGLIDLLHQFLGGMLGFLLAVLAWRSVYGARAGEYHIHEGDN